MIECNCGNCVFSIKTSNNDIIICKKANYDIGSYSCFVSKEEQRVADR